MKKTRVDWSHPDLSEDDRKSIEKVTKTGWLSEGKVTEKFERKLAEYLGCKQVIVVNNATAALLTSLWASDLKPKDEVIVPTYTFIATINTPYAIGATPVLADCNLQTLNSEPQFMKKALHSNTKAVLPVDIAGMPFDQDAFHDFITDNNLLCIEDAAEAFGATYKNKMIGSFGHPSIFSFHIAKSITTIEGGCIATNDNTFARKCRMIKNHGAISKTSKTIFPSFGLNFRTTDVQSALGLSQLKRVDKFLKNRNRIAQLYTEELEGLVGFQNVPEYVTRHGRMFFPIFVNRKKRDSINKKLNNEGISTRICWIPAHKQPYHSHLFRNQSFPNAETISKTIITIPLGNQTSVDDAMQVVAVIKKIMKG